MIMRPHSILSLVFLLLIAAAIPSCKSPISPTPAGPTLTLILPDSAHVFDTVTLRAHYSDSLKPTWDYAWQFGDSTKASTRDTAISHIYDSAGTYTVQVALTDTALHQTIAKQMWQIKILPPNSPTLTLTAPDTNYWGDSCVMSVSSSQPLKAGWKFSWSLGDSTTVTGTDSVLHYYPTPGNYKVTLSLNDTVHHIPLTSKSATISVVARHFNLVLLQSMPYVEYTVIGQWVGTSSGNYNCGGTSEISIKPLVWSGTAFSMSSNYTFNNSVPSAGQYDSGSGGISINGTTDPNLSQLVGFSEGSGYSSVLYGENGGYYCFYTSSSSFNITNVPFKQESDSDVVFEANGNLIKNASDGGSWTSDAREVGPASQQSHVVFNDSSFVTIRFHN